MSFCKKQNFRDSIILFVLITFAFGFFFIYENKTEKSSKTLNEYHYASKEENYVEGVLSYTVNSITNPEFYIVYGLDLTWASTLLEDERESICVSIPAMHIDLSVYESELPIKEIGKNAFRNTTTLDPADSFYAGPASTSATPYKILSFDFSKASNIRIIRSYAFDGATVPEIDLSGMINLVTIEMRAFVFTSAKTVNFSGLVNLEEISLFAFYATDITELELVDLPKLEKIGYYAFANNVFTKITLKNLPKIKALSGFCNSLCVEEIIIENLQNLTTIDIFAFDGSTFMEISFIDCPNISTIESFAFSKCPNLTYFDLTQFPNLAYLSEEAFKDSGIRVYQMGYIETIDKNAFDSINLELIIVDSKETYDIYSAPEHNMHKYLSKLTYEMEVTFLSGLNKENTQVLLKLYNLPFTYVYKEEQWVTDPSVTLPVPIDVMGRTFIKWIDLTTILQSVTDVLYEAQYSSKDINATMPINIEYQTYNGTQIAPVPVIMDGDITLLIGIDYTIIYGTNINVGTGTIDVIGIKEYYGEYRIYFYIINNQNIQEVVDAINSIPDDINSKGDRQKVLDAQRLYDALTEEEKAQITIIDKKNLDMGIKNAKSYIRGRNGLAIGLSTGGILILFFFVFYIVGITKNKKVLNAMKEEYASELSSLRMEAFNAGKNLPNTLTSREYEIAALMLVGKKRREIAAILYISENTVKTHINHIMEKTDCVDAVGFILKYK